jgi:hypothetical protein
VSETTPGRAAYEAKLAAEAARYGIQLQSAWDRMDDGQRSDWEAGAQAGNERLRAERDAFLGALKDIIDTADASSAYTPADLREIASKAFRDALTARLAGEDGGYGQEDEADEAKYRCPETSDGEHAGDWHDGGRCMACGQSGPEPGPYESSVLYRGAEGSLW